MAQLRTNIDDRVNRVVETGNATQSRIRADLDELTVRVVSKSAAQEQQKMNVEDVMAKLAAHEVKLLEAEERENEKQRQATADAKARRAETEEDKGSRNPEPHAGKEDKAEQKEEEERAEKKPPGSKTADDPLQVTGWRAVEEYHICSPIRGRDWAAGNGGKGEGGKGGPDGATYTRRRASINGVKSSRMEKFACPANRILRTMYSTSVRSQNMCRTLTSS